MANIARADRWLMRRFTLKKNMLFLTKKILSLPLHSWLLSIFLVSYAIYAEPVQANPTQSPNYKTPATATSNQANLSGIDPDAVLINIYKYLSQNKLNEAQQLADKLVAAYPTFRLGHLIQGDLLMMHTAPISTFGDIKNAPPDKLKDLRDEARVRILSISERPNPNLIPRAVLQLRPDQKHVLVVDSKRSRLYLYENNNGQIKFVSYFYFTQGKLGVDKNREGDQKTPLGVYYITSHLPGAKLTDFYGLGALPINYPNEWDRINGRSGKGIWLHGTPSNNFSRPPLASDGCVVLTNPDLQKVMNSVEIGKTPVVITEKIELVAQDKWKLEHDEAVNLIEKWRLDVESKNSSRWLSHYSNNFKNPQGEPLLTWFTKQQQQTGLMNANIVSVKLKDLTLFNYPSKENLLVSTFTQETHIGSAQSTVRKRQYWTKEAGNWKIILESNL